MNTISFKSKDIAPSKVVCVGRNYAEHIKELNNEIPSEPVLFIKPNSAIASQLSLPANELIHYETEMCFLIQNKKLAAVTVGLDLTKRELQSQLKSKGLPWERAKAFNNSALFGEFKELPKTLGQLSLKLYKNGELVQQGHFNEMMTKPEQLLEVVQRDFKMCDGDILMTGTPSGVGPLSVGDKMVAQLFNEKVLVIEQAWLALSPN